MPNPYVWPVRERAVAAYEAGAGSYADVSAGLAISQRTLERWVAKLRATGDVAALPKRGGWRSPVNLKVLHGLVAERADATSPELRRRHNQCVPRGARVSVSAIVRALKHAGYVLKKTAAAE